MKVAFLYTLASNQPLFARYIKTLERQPTVSIIHHVDGQLLTNARTISNKDDEIRVTQQVHDSLADIIDKNAPDIIICTCSTIGDMAESFTAKLPNIIVLRVDRPMANVAVENPYIHVVAALESTIQPTTALLQECADAKGVHLSIETIVVPNAWSCLENGDPSGYAESVAAYLVDQYNGASGDAKNKNVVIVLAQASMSPAVDLLSADQLAKCPKILISPATCMDYLLQQIDA